MKSGMKMMAVNEMRRRRDSRGRFMEGGQGGQMEMGYSRMEGGGGQGNYNRMEGGSGGRMEGGGGSGRMGGYDRMESEMRGGGGRMESEMRRGGGGRMEAEMRGGRGGGGNRREGGNLNRMEEGGASGGYWPGPHMPPYGDEPQRKIGFGANRSEAEMGGYSRMEDEEPSMRRRRDSRGRYMEGGQSQQEMRQGNVSYFPQERTSMHYGGGGEGKKMQAGGTFWMMPPEGGEKLTREKGEKWVKKMKGDDPQARGEMWSYEDAKTLAEERGISPEGQEMVDFYVVLNMVYNNYCKVAKKYGVDTEDYYADLAHAWLYDKDGKPPTEKLMAYHKYVIPHEED